MELSEVTFSDSLGLPLRKSRQEMEAQQAGVFLVRPLFALRGDMQPHVLVSDVLKRCPCTVFAPCLDWVMAGLDISQRLLGF
jgi:hypothetical protein